MSRLDPDPLSTAWSPASKKVDSCCSRSLLSAWLLVEALLRICNLGETWYLLAWYPCCYVAVNTVAGLGVALFRGQSQSWISSYTNLCNPVSALCHLSKSCNRVRALHNSSLFELVKPMIKWDVLMMYPFQWALSPTIIFLDTMKNLNFLSF